MMSEKAVGTDWKKKLTYTLRHATGCSKFTTIEMKTESKEKKTKAIAKDKSKIVQEKPKFPSKIFIATSSDSSSGEDDE